jgi:F-type H+-transporting ATPase subunit a
MSDTAAGVGELVDKAELVNRKSAAINEWIMHHVSDSDKWHPLPFLEVPLPGWMSNHVLMLLIGAGLLVLVFKVLCRYQPGRAPRGWTNLMEVLVKFVRDDICVATLGEEDGRKMAPLFLTFFFFIATLNLMGLVPLFSTATGNIGVTAALAIVTFCFMVFGAIYMNGPIAFAKGFVPSGIPWPILIIIVPLEVLGVAIKCIALTIRLFANMFAGHIVVFSLLGLLVTFGVAALPAVVMALAIDLLEIFIALLQAYIFTLLSAMFIGQMYHPAH